MLEVTRLGKNVPTIGIAIGLGLIIIGIALWIAFAPPAPAQPRYRPVPTATAQPEYFNLVNPQDYFDGKCQIASEDAAPEWYADHPGAKRCEFKTVLK